jgi:F-type H+-transporting ATPase subunit epsilon
MAQIRCEIVTAERTVFEGDVDLVLAPGMGGQLGILPHHAPLMTALSFGELVLRREGLPDEFIAIGGGFMEAGPEHVIILADSAERAEEIDVARAEEARQRARETMAQKRKEDVDFARAEASLRRSLIRLKVAQRRRRATGRRPETGPPPASGSGGQA